MRNLYLAIIIICEILLISLSWYIGYESGRHSITAKLQRTDTLTITDTIPYYKPVAKDSVVVKYITRMMSAKKDTSFVNNYAHNLDENIRNPPDSVVVDIPITQKEYQDSTYHAWVSGYEAKLDSISVYQRTTTITKKEIVKSKNRLSIGLIGGYGYGLNSKQTEPFIGLGVSYSIISF